MKFVAPPKLWVAWFLAVVLAIVASLMFAGCATGEAYRGPVALNPIVTVTEQRHIMQRGPRDPAAMETIATLNVTNPNTNDITVHVDCEGENMSRTGGTTMTLDVPARSTQHLLLLSEDKSCVTTWQ